MAGQPSQPQHGAVTGIPPTAEDKFWLELAREELLPPAKSLDRFDSYAKFVLGSVSLVGTALTGFGIFTPNVWRSLNSAWLILPVALFCVSLALAIMGITPKVNEIKPDDVNSIRRYYTRLINWRGKTITWAGYFFAASFLAAPVVLYQVNSGQSQLQPEISMRLTGTDDAATLDASVKLVNVPLSATAKTEVLGYGAGTGAQPVTLFSDISHADSAGTVSVSTGGLSKLKDYKRLVMRMSAASGNAVLYEGVSSIEK